ncbi:MAG TPA: amidohydrolase family protein [Candidatus Dormibacteraeota bacterium]|nr:amidohydrolase family protein [Candidatus Dormibacteraeota bacterium]
MLRDMGIIAIEEHYASARPEAGGPRRPVPAEIRDRMLDLGDGRIADMDAAGIEMQVLSLSAAGVGLLAPADAVAFVREENDRLAEAVARRPDRLAAFATLPMADPAAAAKELERTVHELGFKGAMVNGHTDGRFLDDPSFRPILECAAALDVPVYLHPAPPPEPVARAYFGGLPPAVSGALATAAWGWHVETGLHVLRVIAAGVLDRLPGLQLVVGHMGEALPFMLARTTAALPRAVTGLERSVAEYVRGNVHVTTSGFFTVPPFLTALLEVGADRIMLSVDYPFSPNQQGRAFLDALPVSPADREKIARGNAARLLHL